MPSAGHSHWMITVKKYAYLLVVIPPALLLLSQWLWQHFGYPDLFAFLVLGFVFGLIPLLDHLVGQDPVNPDEQQEVPRLSEETFYRVLTLLCLPMQLATIVWAGHVFMTTEMSWVGQLGWLLSVGTVGGIVAINVGHELIHKDPRLEQWAGGALLASVCYAGFKVEHVRGHHVHVSTPEDASSSRYGQSLYAFLPQAYLHNFLNAWKLEAKRLQHKGFSAFSWRNELLWWYGLSLLMTAGCGLLWGWMGVLYFVAQSFFAFSLLEVINYVEHYGLHRRKLESGRYERPDIQHSWNSNFLLTNLFLFQLQRHSDHHAYPKRRYQVLRHHDESPQLPSGYATMVVLALIPPLWFKVMNPRVEGYYQGEEHQLASV
ncbi:alkane 1-monooxygenase [Venatoribacter cucullus]|uniref:alkane 1-monooxygenase n=1 Tax=Venatoribacter cucullus TaxID=2661630 RepID=UPI00223EBDB1|nr:alkane 1-monooxygenase [Venatoribacter cucullus]UZK03280.1 alkane 1-monooxygenase [Venatoribacter cucullus]